MAEPKPFEFDHHARVKKAFGYAFFGSIVAAFRTLHDENRFVVESTSYGSRGLLFIFRADQLALDDDER